LPFKVIFCPSQTGKKVVIRESQKDLQPMFPIGGKSGTKMNLKNVPDFNSK